MGERYRHELPIISIRDCAFFRHFSVFILVPFNLNFDQTEARLRFKLVQQSSR